MPVRQEAQPSCRPGGVQIDEPLVAAAPETERDVFQFLYEPAVHQNVQQGEEFVRHLAAGVGPIGGQFLIGEAEKDQIFFWGYRARTRRRKGTSTRWFSGSKGSPPRRVRPLI